MSPLSRRPIRTSGATESGVPWTVPVPPDAISGARVVLVPDSDELPESSLDPSAEGSESESVQLAASSATVSSTRSQRARPDRPNLGVGVDVGRDVDRTEVSGPAVFRGS